MIFIKNHLILGAIKKIISTVFKIVYKVLSAFNLQPLLFVCVVGLILVLTGTVAVNQTVKITFIVLTVLSVFYSVIATVYKIFGFGRRKKSKVDIVKEDYANMPAESVPVAENRTSKIEPTFHVAETTPPAEREVFPKYYNVRQNSAYFFAEYADRYELYLKTANGARLVRVDIKR